MPIGSCFWDNWILSGLVQDCYVIFVVKVLKIYKENTVYFNGKWWKWTSGVLSQIYTVAWCTLVNLYTPEMEETNCGMDCIVVYRIVLIGVQLSYLCR